MHLDFFVPTNRCSVRNSFQNSAVTCPRSPARVACPTHRLILARSRVRSRSRSARAFLCSNRFLAGRGVAARATELQQGDDPMASAGSSEAVQNESEMDKGTEASWTGRALPVMERTGCIYLDYNATTPIYPEVAQEMDPYLHHHFGNPSSSHVYGRECSRAVDVARERVASLVGCSSTEIYFTSCGTESNNWAIWSAITSATRSGIQMPHVVTSVIEHPAVLSYLRFLEQQGLLTYDAVGVSEEGIVSPEDVKKAMTIKTVLVSIMHSNNEVGAIQPVKEIAEMAKKVGSLMHCDAAQSLGKVSVNVQDLGVDMLSIVGHKFGAPKGVGTLYIRKGVEISPLLHGGGQEAGKRSGTENVLLIVGLGKASHIAKTESAAIFNHMQRTRDELQRRLTDAFGNDSVRVNGPVDDAKRLPNTLNMSVAKLDSNMLLGGLREQVAASTGSACHSGGVTVSGVLSAMGVPVDFARGTLRLSTGRHTTMEDISKAAELIVTAAKAQWAQE